MNRDEMRLPENSRLRIAYLDMLICRFIPAKEPNRTGKNRDYFSSAFLCFFFSILLIFINFHSRNIKESIEQYLQQKFVFMGCSILKRKTIFI